MTGFAAAKLLHDAGNRVGFSLAGGDVGLHFTTAADEPLSLALTRAGGAAVAAAGAPQSGGADAPRWWMHWRRRRDG